MACTDITQSKLHLSFRGQRENGVPIYYKSYESVRDQMITRASRWIIGRVATRRDARRPHIESARLYKLTQFPQHKPVGFNITAQRNQ